MHFIPVSLKFDPSIGKVRRKYREFFRKKFPERKECPSEWEDIEWIVFLKKKKRFEKQA
ncbi:MAG TPA: hypothetical protein PK765_02760 [bacterium]|nr:hypothetical protein [bacterium]